MTQSAFPVTRWTLVTAATLDNHEASAQALAELCQAYWYPVYAFIRRLGRPADEAEDLTQEFFARFLERRYFATADREKGRFRSFLLIAVKRFLADETDFHNAEKRGGKIQWVPLDANIAEQQYCRALAHQATPEVIFEREWARTLISRVMSEVRAEFSREGRFAHFESLSSFLPGEDAAPSYTEVANRMGTTEGALKVAVHRIRRRYRDLIHAEIAQLVSDPAEVAGEVQHLLNALRG